MRRRDFLTAAGTAALAGYAGGAFAQKPNKRPNILFAISDDQSWCHTSAMGAKELHTPTFDRIAREGVLFTQAFCSAPSCTASRGAVLTGQDFWRLEEGATLWGALPAKFPVYTHILEEEGYRVGSRGKGWGPGNLEASGREVNPAGKRYKDFSAFYETVGEDQPFCFWFGSSDPHRPYKVGSGIAQGKDPNAIDVPPFLPDAPVVRSDILDYFVEIERFDTQLGQAIALLEEAGELDNTLVIVTSDNGMPWPRAKANIYDYGTRMPFAVRWGAEVPGGRVVEDLVSLTDVAPTVLEAAGLAPLDAMTGRSLMNVLLSTRQGRVDAERDRAYTGLERHTWLRGDGGECYPCRAIRTHDYLYIRNFEPDRWPAGDPPVYRDIDGNSPTKTYYLEHQNDPDVAPLFHLATAKRPAEELYYVPDDPGQMQNLADGPAHADARQRLSKRLDGYLRKTRDPRVLSDTDPFEANPYFGRRDIKPGD